jgi:hypothetical protein
MILTRPPKWLALVKRRCLAIFDLICENFDRFSLNHWSLRRSEIGDRMIETAPDERQCSSILSSVMLMVHHTSETSHTCGANIPPIYLWKGCAFDRGHWMGKWALFRSLIAITSWAV